MSGGRHPATFAQATWGLAVALLVFGRSWSAVLGAEPAADRERDESKFVRLQRDESGKPIALETAIVSYRPASGMPADLQVDLVAVVHIADKQYYQQLNRELSRYEAVLYELVARPDDNVPKPGHRGSGVTGVQRLMTDMLDLQFQLDHIDYTPKHFVHADLSPRELAERMKERGESFWKFFFRAIGYSAAAQSNARGPSDVDVLAALLSKNRAVRLKRIMAEEMEDMDSALAIFGGEEGSSLITDRNTRALEVLRKQLQLGQRKIAIFYGAGHMPDLEERLIDQFGMTRSGQRWLRAWSIPAED